MPSGELALVSRARGLATHLVGRETLETLADAPDVGALARGLSQLAAIDPIGEPRDARAIERAVQRTASRHFQTLYRWQEWRPGVLDVFAADQDRRNLRALLRGAVQGAPSEARLAALVPTPLLPQRALGELARHPSAADVARQLVRLPYPDASRLLPIVAKRHPDLLALDRALLLAFAERTTRVAARADDTLREFVRTVIDAGNVQNALLIAGAPRDLDPEDNFVAGGRWLSAIAFMSAANAGSPERALTRLAAALARSPLGAMLPVVATDIAHMDRAFLVAVLQRLARAARLEPLGTAPVLRVLLLIAAQSRDLRTLTWGAALGSPASRRRQQLVTPS